MSSLASESEALRQFAFFASFSAAQLRAVAERAPRQTLAAGTTVVRIGELSATMYLILRGTVSIQRADEQGQEVELATLGPPQTFGELALLSSEPRLATVTTVTDCEFLLIDRPLLLDILSEAGPEAILQMFAVLSRQIRAANEEDFRKRLARRTLEAQMEVEKQRSLTQLVAGVAHEINTPLGIINTAVSIMEREAEKLAPLATDRQIKSALDDLGEALELVRGNVHRAHRLVQDFKKVSVSQLSDVCERLNLPEAVQETLSLARINYRRLTIRFHNQLPADAHMWMGYRGYLAQILLNLLANVDRYAYLPDQSGVVDVELTSDPTDAEMYVLVIRDFGRGISEADLGRVFEPFFTTGRAQGGTGLGLTIVYNLATTALKGRITIHSTAGQGTEVRLVFPRVIE